jgi:hypothetical protein
LDDAQTINLTAVDVRIRDRVVPIHTDPTYYWARRIEVPSMTHEQIDESIAGLPDTLPTEVAESARRNYESMRDEVGKFCLRTWHLARGLVPEHRDLLLASDAERRLGIPAGLTKLLEVDEWDHPRLMEGELPSWCESFRLIAEALAKGDPDLYRPTEPANTHWSNWPLSGNL